MNEIGFVVIDEGIERFSDGYRKRFRSDRPAAEVFDNRTQNRSVVTLKAEAVDFEARKTGFDDILCDPAASVHLRKIAHTLEHAVCDAGRSARTRCDEKGRIVVDRNGKQLR